jgi:hypothetical protein
MNNEEIENALDALLDMGCNLLGRQQAYETLIHKLLFTLLSGNLNEINELEDDFNNTVELQLKMNEISESSLNSFNNSVEAIRQTFKLKKFLDNENKNRL